MPLHPFRRKEYRSVSFLLIYTSFFATLIFTYFLNPTKDIQKSAADTNQVAPATILNTPTPTLIPTPTQTPTPTYTPTPTLRPKPTALPGNFVNVYVTYYGFSDNSPPGPAIAYPASKNSKSIHETAGGAGTFADPLTFAADPNYLAVGTKIYLPYIQKYALMEDLCASCGAGHIDVWMESTGAFESELYACQNRFTRRSEQIELNPPPGRAIIYAPLFNKSNGQCLGS